MSTTRSAISALYPFIFDLRSGSACLTHSVGSYADRIINAWVEGAAHAERRSHAGGATHWTTQDPALNCLFGRRGESAQVSGIGGAAAPSRSAGPPRGTRARRTAQVSGNGEVAALSRSGGPPCGTQTRRRDRPRAGPRTRPRQTDRSAAAPER